MARASAAAEAHSFDFLPRSTTTSLRASSFPIPLTGRNPAAAFAVRATLAALALLVVALRDRIFYPGSRPDPDRPEPLPPGTMGGCPWIGSLSMYFDMNRYFHRRASVLGAKLGLDSPPRIWKMFGFGKPMAILSGSSNIRSMLGREFKKGRKKGDSYSGGAVSQATDFGSGQFMEMIFGTESMSFETSDATKYRFLQKLVGQSLTPEAVAKGVPALQESSEKVVDRMLSSAASSSDGTVVVEDMCKYLTLDVAWRQIIGLNLKGDDEIAAFHSAVKMWLKSLSNYLLFLLPWPAFLLRSTKTYRAKQYLDEKIMERIDELKSEGPDGSTMSAMLCATDEEDSSAKLSKKQVIDNTFLLLIAGSETSSNTLTDAMLLLGLHPEAWDKLVKEQEDLVARRGPNLTKAQIDDECPYLDAVVRETMRICPISGGGVRTVDETLVVDGVQVPKGWWAMYSVGLTHEADPKTRVEDGSHMDMRAGFRPERWLNEETRPTTEWMPFGAGHRFCLGHNLAIAEMRTFLAVMARKVKAFDLVTDVDKVKWKEGVILTPKDGVVIAPHSN